VISKVQRTHRWQLTKHGATIAALITGARFATPEKLLAV
jgi:hypothetical protein